MDIDCIQFNQSKSSMCPKCDNIHPIGLSKRSIFLASFLRVKSKPVQIFTQLSPNIHKVNTNLLI